MCRENAMAHATLQVENQEQGMRLDVLLAGRMPSVSRSRARKACEQGKVLVNGAPQRPGYLLKANEVVELLFDPAPVSARADLAQAAGGPLKHIQVLFEDAHLLAIEKPRMMHCTRLRTDDPLTVADCLAAYSADASRASEDPREAGMVQRLDYYTSGVLLAAKSREMWQALHRILVGGQIEKEYLALVQGRFKDGPRRIGVPLVDDQGGKKVAVSPKGRAAHSVVELAQRPDVADGEQDLLLVRGSGMRRHQVRAHLAHIGHPLVGDSLYGAREESFRLICNGNEREGEGFFLHALSVRFLHPVGGAEITIRTAESVIDDIVGRRRSE